ncbi:non-hydrolyzing UDP-N-acetylglucosamine 2-epimerase [Pseudomonas plecoglossicida]|uniref:non-hydrolyzing UDP-N-acetylglucosamine 2-epimerase n=1 Tax=Pseudomonas plecoglossicida TaxID=70775 RepID=UPI0015E42334|nr:UDP-N-acetylglucosamine 2-epimerase (non-hydrolyzing) [Pseudomonas plecoglossicida]MBA1321428.1 UDP-N-acetylglucosamine 2-epimerase (non-hydrolyzing) [Pseudomonas plecoglossicida]
MKILTLIGARPQFIKSSVVSQAMLVHSGLSEVTVHTGQHYDRNMSDIFFQQLGLSAPDYQLNIHGGSHGAMTGRMLTEIEKAILHEKPDRVLVYGDTNSTLAGALAASKLNIPVAHVEAGLRSFNMRMPEEVNRILTDQVSDTLFCPTLGAVKNLVQEGFEYKPVKVLNVGDVMQDCVQLFAGRARPPARLKASHEFILATLHRAENTDDPARLKSIVDSLNQIHREVAPVVLPLHPRTRATLKLLEIKLEVEVIEPVGYLQMLWLLQQCGLVLTDSGGLQKEAYFLGKGCVTLREQTEWVELVECGANVLVGADRDKILDGVRQKMGKFVKDDELLYGGGQAAVKIADYFAEI